jgi:mannose-6-phosphate isomerase-like protein (cupin superfamily)
VTMSFTILDKDELQRDGTNYEFEGYLYGDTGISFIWVDVRPGRGPRLHKHPYAEILIILEGNATYTIGSATLEAAAGKVLIVPPDTPHSFFNSGDGPLRQIDIHLNKQFVTEWLE